MAFRTFTLKRKVLHVMALSALLVSAGNAVAMGLGELVLYSHLGSTLHAEIRLIEAAGGARPVDECFRLGAADGNQDLPVLTHGRLRLEQRNGQNRLVITSDQTINDPALQINLWVGCGSELVRTYTLLIDPGEPVSVKNQVSSSIPERTEAPAKPFVSTGLQVPYPTTWETVRGETAESITKALFPRQPRAQRRFLKALQVANPQLDLGVNGEIPLSAGIALDIPDTRRASPSAVSAPEYPLRNALPQKLPENASARKPVFDGKMSDRLVISAESAEIGDPTALSLRMSQDISTRLSSKVSDNARAMLRVEYRLLNALLLQATQQLEVAEQVRILEARFEEMRTTSENVMQRTEAARVSVGTTTPVPTRVPVVKEKSAVSPAPSEAVAALAAKQSEESSGWWLGALSILILAGGLAWWLATRYRVRNSPSDTNSGSASLSVIEPDKTLQSLGGATEIDQLNELESKVSEHLTTPPIELDIRLDEPQTLFVKESGGSPSAPPVPAIEVSHMSEADDPSTVLELAEIMVSFGRIKGAAQALVEYLDNNPEASLVPWMKLLEIYRMHEMQKEFAACSIQLRSHFNVAPASWDEAGECLSERITTLHENDLSIEDVLQKLPTVGSLPHVREGIVRTWNSPDGLDYLRHLLRDTRNGQRSGFPLPIARELLFLLDLQEAKLRHNT